MSNINSRKYKKHLIVGTPYEPDCPICQAHGNPVEGMKELNPGVFIVEVDPSDEDPECDCPLCVTDEPDPRDN